ncbi:hypothetical protein KTQ42_11250|uniref:hypothetical protein n=1 Tax=Noviherbaspirillum sp. L7-7A TaxID=2850560 RepID=UPI001C2C8AE9|nr:hypothetical protein [Noviherbaspirillum sp. L7-7A]MBV0879879.1 hypothetical protein [Noviherbaspirillum sp. L7-7A]
MQTYLYLHPFASLRYYCLTGNQLRAHCYGSFHILIPFPSLTNKKVHVKNNQLSSLEQLRKLVNENPVLQQKLQESHDLPSAMEAVRHFAEQWSGT